MTPREAQLSQQLEQCQEALVAAQREITLLRQKLDALARRIFGVSSEALDPAQLQLLLQLSQGSVQPIELVAAKVEVAPVGASQKVARKNRAPRLPEHLPVVEEVIDPEPVKKQPENWRCIGEANAGERSAILYTLIESCRRRHLDPYAYLRDVLTRLPHMTNRQIPHVIPSAWKSSPLQQQFAS